MKRVKVTVAYDGTEYCGWQIQPNGITIESVLNQTLSTFLKEEICVIGASRTDSGVHALGNVAVFDTEAKIPADKICHALNRYLPQDIRIQDSKEVAMDFHPRRVACKKTYEYRILNRRFEFPLYRNMAYFIYTPLNLLNMQKAATYFLGEHDFKSFCSAGSQVETTIRRIEELSVTKEGDFFILRVRGNGFLYNMVRIIAGTLIQVGIGAYPPERIKEILEAKDRKFAGPTAPARGLLLVGIDYEDEI